MTEQSSLLLRKQLADDDDIYQWEVVVIGPQDTLFEGGFFKATLTFPRDYPLRPPKLKFVTEIWHPNVAKNGDVCISILHEPGEDKYGYEKPEERWLPIHTVETIMISVISMLADPNGDSAANVDAAKEWRDDPKGIFKKKAFPQPVKVVGEVLHAEYQASIGAKSERGSSITSSTWMSSRMSADTETMRVPYTITLT
ncbi:hypothetical protein F7725_015412, partial [Dissostichus mawsoni]